MSSNTPEQTVFGKALNQTAKDIGLLNRAIEDIVKRFERSTAVSPGDGQSITDVVEAVLRHEKLASIKGGGDPNTLYVNEHLPKEVQEDVLKAKPTLTSHSEAVQKVFNEKWKPGMKVVMRGVFKLSKLPDTYLPERFGTDNRKISDSNNRPITKFDHMPLNGAQPCLYLPILEENEIDFNCVFIIDKPFQDGIHIGGYRGTNIVKNMGKWFTQAVLDVDPDKRAQIDWAGALGKTEHSVGLWPEKDRHTGASVKGTATDGFNNTTSDLEMSLLRNNQVDTSGLNYGGYPDGSNGHRFPQSDGTYSQTWGVWRGGFIGHNASALVIYQVPEVSAQDRESAVLRIERHYARGFRTGAIEIGLMGTPSGDVLPRYPNSPESRQQVYQYVPYNVYLYNVIAEDNYETGIQLNRGVNIWEVYSTVRRSGHPNWSLNDYRVGQEGAAQVDPGYGTSSGRASPQINRHVLNGTYVDCARKGIDAHHGGDTEIANNYIKAGVWGIQVAIEENQVDRFEDSSLKLMMSRWAVHNNRVHSSVFGIDFVNGAFKHTTHVDRASRAPLWALRADISIRNNLISAPFGVRNNYNRAGQHLEGNTYVFDAPYGIRNGFNTSLFRAIWVGASNTDKSRGSAPSHMTIRNERIYNSTSGNYATGIFIEAIDVLTIDNCYIDVTPFTTDKLNGAIGPFTGMDVIRSTHATNAITYGSRTNIKNLRVSNTFSHNMISEETKELIVGGLAAEKVLEKIEREKQENGGTSTTSPPNTDEPREDTGESSPMTQPEAASAPKETLPEIKFNFDGATNDRIVSIDGKVPLELRKASSVRIADGTSDFVHADQSPRYIQSYLAAPTARAGVYPVITGVNISRPHKTTIIIPIWIENFGGLNHSYVLSPSDAENQTQALGSLLADKSKTRGTTHMTFRKPEEQKVRINGNPVATNEEVEYGKWMILSTVVSYDAANITICSQYNGNGMTQCKIGEGLQIYPNRELPEDELLRIIGELKTQYNIA